MKKRVGIVVMIVLLAVAFAEAATEDKVVMSIEGMTCSLCTVAVKKALSKVEGVHTVEVFLEEHQAWLTVDGSVEDDTLVKAVQKAGYQGSVLEREPAADDSEV